MRTVSLTNSPPYLSSSGSCFWSKYSSYQWKSNLCLLSKLYKKKLMLSCTDNSFLKRFCRWLWDDFKCKRLSTRAFSFRTLLLWPITKRHPFTAHNTLHRYMIDSRFRQWWEAVCDICTMCCSCSYLVAGFWKTRGQPLLFLGSVVWLHNFR